VVIEAMALGVPVVASDLPALAGVVENGRTALLVPPASPAALAAAIDRVLTEPALAAALGRAGRSAFEAHFTLEASVAGMAALYERLAGRAVVPT
jgi:glycosyltransferase involved in cell wall biosynthesis